MVASGPPPRPTGCTRHDRLVGSLLLFLAFASGPAEAGARRDARKAAAAAARQAQKGAPVDPKLLTDFTAYTTRPREWRIGPFDLQYGLLDNLSVGLNPLAFVVAPNIGGKVTAIQTRRVDVAFKATYYQFNLDRLDAEGVTGRFAAAPLAWTASWMINEHFGLHGGSSHWLVKLDGGLSGKEISEGLAALLGTDISGDLGASESGLYGASNLALHQLNLAFDWRPTRRGSLILESNSYLLVTGVLSAGAQTVDEANDSEVSVGASVRLSQGLKTVPNATSLAWQWSWPRFHLRVGIPLNPTNPFSYTQAFTLYWVLGGKDKG